MALEDTDLFVIQSQTDSNFYKVRLDSLIAEIQSSDVLTFRGSVDLNDPPAASGVILPGDNGDVYLVESDAIVIDNGWVIQTGQTSANLGDRLVYDGNTNNWILIQTGTFTVGTVTDVTATLPVESDGHPVNPVISIIAARTNTAATNSGDGKGTEGTVARLAEQADVDAADPSAVVTADLLKATNGEIEAINDALDETNGEIEAIKDALDETNDAIDALDYLSLSATAGTQTVLSPGDTIFTGNVGLGTSTVTKLLSATNWSIDEDGNVLGLNIDCGIYAS